ncbi:MAG: type II toxin-antitoxin system RelB/DinJ family antitoxin [Candidatus Yonathbacteria bacterium]|nr:type II toxin-antitoxin system RelB/DinJ family antitoxin [Candidatus Yonathbacteria bacterium]
MKTAVLNIKIDPKVKNEAQKVADELGFTLSAIINASLKNLARNKAVSFSVLEPSPRLKRSLRSSDADYAKGKNSVGPFYDAESMIRSLRQ